MASPSSTAGDSSYLNHPLVKTITDSIVHLQKQNLFSNERLQLLKHHFLITIGFLVLLYCLIHIQILFFWLIKFIFRSVFRVISIIFWLPLNSLDCSFQKVSIMIFYFLYFGYVRSFHFISRRIIMRLFGNGLINI